jgi:hypothetical protein
MLIWLNGPFGGGKTQTASELGRRLHDAVVCDPELVGYGLQHTIPSDLRPDFQTLASWRLGVVEVLDHTLRHHPGPVVAPMTLVEPAYFEEIIGGLRARGHDVRHFALVAPPAVVRRRLRGRRLGGLHPGGARWALEQVDRCLDALVRPEFAVHVDTERSTVSQVADLVANRCDLPIAPDTDGPLRGRLRRARVHLRSIRMG